MPIGVHKVGEVMRNSTRFGAGRDSHAGRRDYKCPQGSDNHSFGANLQKEIHPLRRYGSLAGRPNQNNRDDSDG